MKLLYVWFGLVYGFVKEIGIKKIFENVGNNFVEEKGFNDEWFVYILFNDIFDLYIV